MAENNGGLPGVISPYSRHIQRPRQAGFFRFERQDAFKGPEDFFRPKIYRSNDWIPRCSYCDFAVDTWRIILGLVRGWDHSHL